MKLHMVLVLSAGSLAAMALVTKTVSQENNKLPLEPEHFARLHHLIKPAPGEARWAQVPWMPSTDIWAARKKAAAEGKPLFLWYMAGEPLGTC